MIQPPSVGPIEGASTVTSAYTLNATPRFFGSNESAMMACAIGCRPPPAKPCSTRKTSSNGSVGAIPHRKLEIVNSVMHSRKKFLRPKTLYAQPPSGNTIAFATR